MAVTQEYAYYFEALGRGERQGARDPRSEHFASKKIEDALVRETIQNSLDARSGREPVRVRFELDEIAVHAIPGIESYRSALLSAVHGRSRDLEGSGPLREAADRATLSSVPVLYIHDFGTTGLAGNEGDPTSGLSALTNSSGISSAADGRGGSFGIGAAVGVLASRLRVVAYLTKHAEDPQHTIYASWAQLAGHVDDRGIERHARGIFTDLADSRNLRYPRYGNDGFGPFSERNEPGTSVIVYDYRAAETDPQLVALRRAALESFWAAILDRRLIIEGQHGQDSWGVDHENLDEILESDTFLAEHVLPFRRAFDQEPISATIPELGPVELRIKPLDDGDLPVEYRKPLYTITMRQPLMRIARWVNRSIPRPYAAVLTCRTDEGNEFLRQMEGPSHDEWTSRGVAGQAGALRQLKEFVKTSLRGRFDYETGKAVTVPGLGDDLPDLVPFDADAPLLLHSDNEEDEPEDWSSHFKETDSPRKADRPKERRLAVPTSAGVGGRGDGEGEMDPVNKQRTSRRSGASPRDQRGSGGGAEQLLSTRTFSIAGSDWFDVKVRSSSREAIVTGLAFAGLDGRGAHVSLTPTAAVDSEGNVLEIIDRTVKGVTIPPTGVSSIKVHFSDTRKARIEVISDAN